VGAAAAPRLAIIAETSACATCRAAYATARSAALAWRRCAALAASAARLRALA